ncbi:MAG: hypothetical protein EB084_10820 [Proteobacteria bacterium]|nr:hypothetical protein [Pseudomonadota bacterium]
MTCVQERAEAAESALESEQSAVGLGLTALAALASTVLPGATGNPAVLTTPPPPPTMFQGLSPSTLRPYPAESFAVRAAEDQLLHTVADMQEGRAPTPQYLSGYHPSWHENNDHCYSIYFRAAMRAGILTSSQAESIMAGFPVSNEAAWRAHMFPEGAAQVAFRVTPEGVRVDYGVIPAGHLISMDASAHVMMSTGRRLADGRHEVYSFKGGGPETPVWGDSVGYDPQAKVRVVTLEDELEALQRDDQPIKDVVVVEGPSALVLQER